MKGWLLVVIVVVLVLIISSTLIVLRSKNNSQKLLCPSQLSGCYLFTEYDFKSVGLNYSEFDNSIINEKDNPNLNGSGLVEKNSVYYLSVKKYPDVKKPDMMDISCYYKCNVNGFYSDVSDITRINNLNEQIVSENEFGDKSIRINSKLNISTLDIIKGNNCLEFHYSSNNEIYVNNLAQIAIKKL
jgi:hypothetical protein